jgi:foldase protein PrsA
VKVKVIVWPESEETMAMKAYEKLRSSEEEFDRVARNQADGTLASKGGEVLPFAKGSTGDDRLEEAAFKLKPGETSAIVKTKGRILVMRCTGYEEGAPGNYEKEKVGIEKELREKKIDREVPKIMAALLEEAKPQKFFNPPNTTEKELKQSVEKELKEAGRLNPADAKEPGQVNPAELKDKK